ncbi:CYTH domain-containing protein [Nocardioides sp. W3-2-3]|nr:CYTH domain-containing protein [Nocardioides convexus]
MTLESPRRRKAHNLLELIGWHRVVHVSKLRRTAHLDGVTLTLDVVDQSGAFVELEASC